MQTIQQGALKQIIAQMQLSHVEAEWLSFIQLIHNTAQLLETNCPGKGVISGNVSLQLRQALKAVRAAG